MRDIRILASTGAFIGRPNGRNFRLLPEVLPKVEADGFELLLYDDWYPCLSDVAEVAKGTSCVFPVVHVEKSIGHLLGLGGEEDLRLALAYFDENLRVADKVGASKLVLHLWNGPSLDSHIERNLAAFSLLQRKAKAAGLLLTVENVVSFGKSPENPLDYMRALVEADSEVAFTYDLKMAAFHGQNERIFGPEYAFLWEEGRVAHLHVSDYAGGLLDWKGLKTMHLGKGHINFEEFFRQYNRGWRCDTATLECLSFLPDGSLIPEEMNESIRTLRKLFTL